MVEDLINPWERGCDVWSVGAKHWGCCCCCSCCCSCSLIGAKVSSRARAHWLLTMLLVISTIVLSRRVKAKFLQSFNKCGYPGSSQLYMTGMVKFFYLGHKLVPIPVCEGLAIIQMRCMNCHWTSVSSTITRISQVFNVLGCRSASGAISHLLCNTSTNWIAKGKLLKRRETAWCGYCKHC